MAESSVQPEAYERDVLGLWMQARLEQQQGGRALSRIDPVGVWKAFGTQ